jgi:hypothetical protein
MSISRVMIMFRWLLKWLGEGKCPVNRKVARTVVDQSHEKGKECRSCWI